MTIELPLYTQEKDNTCPLACLRMVLAADDTHVEESRLESHVPMEGCRVGETHQPQTWAVGKIGGFHPPYESDHPPCRN